MVTDEDTDCVKTAVWFSIAKVYGSNDEKKKNFYDSRTKYSTYIPFRQFIFNPKVLYFYNCKFKLTKFLL